MSFNARRSSHVSNKDVSTIRLIAFGHLFVTQAWIARVSTKRYSHNCLKPSFFNRRFGKPAAMPAAPEAIVVTIFD